LHTQRWRNPDNQLVHFYLQDYLMRKIALMFLAASLAAGCGGTTNTATTKQLQDAQAAEQKQADNDEMESRKESQQAAKKAKK
jgi:uncharacterized lipoprotein YmbA